MAEKNSFWLKETEVHVCDRWVAVYIGKIMTHIAHFAILNLTEINRSAWFGSRHTFT